MVRQGTGYETLQTFAKTKELQITGMLNVLQPCTSLVFRSKVTDYRPVMVGYIMKTFLFSD